MSLPRVLVAGFAIDFTTNGDMLADGSARSVASKKMTVIYFETSTGATTTAGLTEKK